MVLWFPERLMSIQRIFAANLRQLCEGKPSVSAVARDLGISHVQFHRFLRGEAIPKPAVLKRICDYFGTDARILIQPLGEIAADHGPKMPAAEAAWQAAMAYSINRQDYFPETPLLPDGVYQVWRNSMTFPDKVAVSLFRVFHQGGAQLVRGFDPWEVTPHLLARRSGVAARFPAERELRGVVVTSGEGASVITFNLPPAQWVCHSFLAPNPHTNDKSFTGIKILGRKQYEGLRRLARTYWRPVGPRLADVIGAARAPVWQELQELPLSVRTILSQPVG